MPHHTDNELLNAAKKLMLTEADEISRSAENLTGEIVKAAREIYACKGRVVVVGLGKSGHVGRKISATLASLLSEPRHSSFTRLKPLTAI